MKDPNGRIRVQVTESDIRKAKVKNSMHCVVAQALARTIPNATRVDVDLQSVRWTENGERQVYLTPYSLQGYVIGFDAGDEIQPFTFMLDPRKRIVTSTQRSTEKGKAVRKARNQQAKAKAKAAELELVATGATLPPPTTAERALAEERLSAAQQTATEAEQLLEETKEMYAGQPAAVPVTEGRRAPSRIHKSSERAYGRRLYRENQIG